jgi:sporulation protein YlmC with PRC-barrel domain
VDEGRPIAYQVLDEGVPVYAADGTPIGTVDHVVAAPEEDIFHGLVIRTDTGRRFVAADQVVSLHERGADLSIQADEVAGLPEPHGGAIAERFREPGVKPSRWREVLDVVTLRNRHNRDWQDEE